MTAIPESRRQELLSRYERAFERSGLPLFIERGTAFERTLTRGIWILALIFLLEVATVVQLERPWWVNAAAVVAALAARLVLVAVLNRRRGRRALEIPESLEAVEAAAFVFAPALLGLLFGGGLAIALTTVAFNVLALGAVFAYYGYGVGAICRWAATHALDELAGSLVLLGRAVPLLLFFSFVLFITTELWEIFAAISITALAGCSLLFGALAALFLAVRLPREVRAFVAEAPFELEVESRHRLNLGIVLFVAQALQVLVVSLMIGLFFVVLGALIITPETTATWTHQAARSVLEIELAGETFHVTEELLRVAAAIAAFSGLYFTISVLTDATYREEFLEELAEELRGVLRTRQEYLRLLTDSDLEPRE